MEGAYELGGGGEPGGGNAADAPAQTTIFLEPPLKRHSDARRESRKADLAPQRTPPAGSRTVSLPKPSGNQAGVLPTPRRSRFGVEGSRSNSEQRVPFLSSTRSDLCADLTPDNEVVRPDRPLKKKKSLFTDAQRKNKKRLERDLDSEEEKQSDQITQADSTDVSDHQIRQPQPYFRGKPGRLSSEVPQISRPSRPRASRRGRSPFTTCSRRREASNLTEKLHRNLSVEPRGDSSSHSNEMDRFDGAGFLEEPGGAFHGNRRMSSRIYQQSPVTDEEVLYSESFGPANRAAQSSTPPLAETEKPSELGDLDQGLAMVRQASTNLSYGAYNSLTPQEWLVAGDRIIERFKENTEKAQSILKRRAQRMEEFTMALQNNRNLLNKRRDELRKERDFLRQGVQASLSGHPKFL